MEPSDLDLIEFAQKYGPQDFDYQDAELQPLAGDAGFRRYYRLTSDPSLMLVSAPPEKERNLEYVRVNDFLANHDIRVPNIHAVSFQAGAFVNEDLGDTLLLDYLTEQNALPLYEQALAMLLRMQSIGQCPGWMSDYSEEQLLKELGLFPEWFIGKMLGMEIDSKTQRQIDDCFQKLVDSAKSQPQAFVHRDFHSRNLMVLSNESLAVIDFQDAVWGPITYDLVSLCKDCYIRWSEERIAQTVTDYAEQLADLGMLQSAQKQNFRRAFDLMGLQRHIKVLGIFSRLNLRDSKPRYLQDLPLVLRYVLETLDHYPEFSELQNWITLEVVPRAEQQPWYSDWKTAGRYLDF